jgi:26S proteasome regulatory subunit N7
MPAENLEEQGLEKNPNLELPQLKFLLTIPERQNDKEIKDKLYQAILAENMAPFYEEVCKELKWTVDVKVLNDMKETNAKKIEELDAAIDGKVLKSHFKQVLTHQFCRC